VAAFALGLLAAPAAQAAPLSVVAAENFYGDVAKQIGGPQIAVTSILSNPDQDPHLFEVSPAIAQSLSGARIVIYSGIGYDPWMAKLLAAAKGGDRTVIVVADLMHRKDGDNPHIWYDPQVMLAFAKALTDTLAADDPANSALYYDRLAKFSASLDPLMAAISALRQRAAGVSVTATEPVCGYLFDAIGLISRNQAFQLAVMNNAEPSAADVAAFETDLKTGAVKLLAYNSQASDPVAVRMRRLALRARVPVVAVTETEPPGKSYQAWMRGQLAAIEQALPQKP
jgi:zinc/manganese transport system substrate-binding protein